MTHSTHGHPLVDEVVDRIVTLFSPKMVIVYRPAAYGIVSEDFDLDLLVVMETDLPYFQRAARMYYELSRCTLYKSIRVLTPREFDYAKTDPYSHTSMVMRTGKVVYGS